MKATPDLFRLVKSLSKPEKRHVTLFLGSGFYKSNKNSLLLFKAIAKQTAFDEEALKTQVGKTISKRFSAEKNKLFDLVLESLMFLYRDALPERRVVRNHLRTWLLFHKGLTPMAWKYFHKTRTMAEQYEFFPQQALLAYLENNQTRLSSAEDVFFSEEKYQGRDKKILHALSEDLTLHTLFTELIDLQKRFGNNPKGAGVHLERIIRHPLLKSSHRLAAFSSLMCRLEIRALYYSMKGKHRQAYACFATEAAEIEKSPLHMEQHFPRYSNALSNQLLHAVLMRDYEIVPQLVQKRKKANERLNYFSYDKNRVEFTGIRFYELIVFKNQADTGKGAAFLAQMEKEFIRYRAAMRDTFVIGILFVFGCYHFYLGNLKKALQHFNDLIDSTNPDVGPIFQCMTRMVKLVLHYELQHFELLPSLAQSLTRLLTKAGRFGVFEKELLSFCRKSAEGANKTALEKFAAATHKYAPGFYSYGAWCDFEFEAWVESRLKNKTFAQLIAEGQAKPAHKKLKPVTK